MSEKYISPETRRTEKTIERTIEGKERENFIKDLEGYVVGLEAALAEPDLPEEERTELDVQLKGLKDSLNAALAGGGIKVGSD